jgi:hypothetical protein
MANEPKQGDAKQGEQKQQAKAGYMKVTVAHSASLGLPPVFHPVREGYAPQVQHSERILQQGENEIPGEHWNAIKDQAPVRNWIEEGLIYEGADRGKREKSTQGTARESLEPLKSDEAMRYVEGSSDRDQLAQWQRTEKRQEVRDAIQRRFDTLGQGK